MKSLGKGFPATSRTWLGVNSRETSTTPWSQVNLMRTAWTTCSATA